MPSSKIDVSQVRVDQVAQLQNISKLTFLDTYGAFNTDQDIKNYLTTHFSSTALLKDLSSPDINYYFACYEGVVTGYIKLNFGKAQKELRDNNGMELERIYVLDKYQGQGIGKVLLNKSKSIALEKGLNYIWLGVWEKNPKAMDFYKKNGFVEFSKHMFVLGNDEQTDIMMRFNLVGKINATPHHSKTR